MTNYDIGDRVTKDGRPGVITGWSDPGDTEQAVDIVLIDGTETFVRMPDYGGRVRKITGGQPEW